MADREELKKAREERARRYGIGVKAGGNLTPPKGYPESPEEYGDPVNFKYPVDASRRINAMQYFNQREHQAQGGYSAEEWGIIGRRIAKALGEDYRYDPESKRVVRKEEESVPVSEFFKVAVAPRRREAEGAEFEGREWDITIIGAREAGDLVEIEGRQFVRSKNKRLYDVEALRESEPMWDGVKVYDNHLTEEEFQQRAGMRSVAKEWIGSITQPRWVGGALPRLDGVLKIVEEAVAKKLKNAWDQGVLGTIGLSIDSLTIQGQEADIEGQRLPVVEGFQKILSVDLVAEPAAGGGFNRLLAAQTIMQEVESMNEEQLKRLVSQLVTEALADSKVGDEKKEALVAAVVQAAMAAKLTEAEDPEAALRPLIKAMVVVEAEPQPASEPQQPAASAEPQAASEPQQQAASAEPQPASEPQQQAASAEASMQERMRKLECKLLLRSKLDEAKLSEPMRRMLEGLFDGKVFEEAELNGAIKRAKEAQAAHDPSGRVAGAGGQRLSVGLNERDVAEIEFMRLLMGNTAFRGLESVEEGFVQERVTESYKAWIKAGRPMYRTRRLSEWVYQLLDGDPFVDQRASEAVTTSGMSSIVKNAMNVLLANDYAKRHRWWEPLVTTEEVDTIDQATLVRVYGLNTLSVVSEGGPYTELGWVDEEETAAFVKKGNYVGVTLETLLSDKVQAVRTLPTRLAAAWYNTISSLVSGVFTVNTNTGPVLADTGALFNATAVTTAGGHANLLTAALTYTAYTAARSAMMKQTDQYSGGASAVQGQRLLIKPKFILVPVDLEAAANAIFNSENIPGSANNDINPYFRECTPIVVPHWTDTNDWALVGDPQEFPAIWLIFLRGKRVPELFTAGDEASGAMFTNDTLRYKVRMLTFRFSATYDCAPVSDFRPVHKSNVS